VDRDSVADRSVKYIYEQEVFTDQFNASLICLKKFFMRFRDEISSGCF
jgi:hypothetical protein